MKQFVGELSKISWFRRAWDGLIEPAWIADARERHLARILNVILLVLLAWGILIEIRSRWTQGFSTTDLWIVVLLGLVALAYFLNRQGQFFAAIVLTLGLFIASTFAAVLLQHVQAQGNLSLLYYLVIAILISDLFFSIRGFLATSAVILGGVFAISVFNPAAEAIFIFLFVFSTLVGFSSYGRRSIEQQQITLAGQYARTQEHLQVMTALQSVSHVITSSLEINQILNNVIKLLRDSFGYTHMSVYLLDGDVLHLGAQLGYSEAILKSEIPVSAGVVGRAARCKETQFIRDVRTDPDFLHVAEDIRSKISVPLMKDEHVLGVLSVEAEFSAALDESDVNVLNALAGPLAIAIDNARLHAEVKRMAMTDVVSGLANRRAFDGFLEAEMIRASRYNQPLSLIILDIDSFKVYNDRWGHPAGDVRLREIADLLRANVREPDMAARYGGEEFAVILPNTAKRGAMRLAERLRSSAEAGAPYRNGENSSIAGYTLSLGVATYPDDATSIEELLLAADNAELAAKRLGKNRVYATNPSENIQNI